VALYINGGWSDNGNLIAVGLRDLGGGSDTILEIMVEPNITPTTCEVRIVPTYKYIVRPSLISYPMWDFLTKYLYKFTI